MLTALAAPRVDTPSPRRRPRSQPHSQARSALPTVVFFLSKMGLITAGFLWRSFRYAFLLIFIAAAVITPTGDMVTQTIFAAPMVALYLLSIAIAWMFGRVTPVRESA